MKKLEKYNKKRDFSKTREPKGNVSKSNKKLRFVIQHHWSRKEHYDFRLEYDGVLKSWAVPKGPSYDTSDKRLAIMVEDHPLEYRNFEGNIPKGEYGGGVVMIWDEGYWEAIGNVSESSIRFRVFGKRIKGIWKLVKFKGNNWLLIKEREEGVKGVKDISRYNRSVRSNRTMTEIKNNVVSKMEMDEKVLESVKISNPDKVIFNRPKISKFDIALYYRSVGSRMLPYINNRIISVVRCPSGIGGECFFKKHLDNDSEGVFRLDIPNKNGGKEDYYYINSVGGLISEVQMNSFEFHTWGSKVDDLERPDILVFDLDPDEALSLKKVRDGVRDLKSVLDELGFKSYLKTSGGKGYHVVVPIKFKIGWEELRDMAKNIVKLMEAKWPSRYVSNVRKVNRKNKIFVDWMRNIRASTSVAPYSLRLKKKAAVSMPIKWSELDKVKPNGISMNEAVERLKMKDPWEGFFD